MKFTAISSVLSVSHSSKFNLKGYMSYDWLSPKYLSIIDDLETEIICHGFVEHPNCLLS